MRGLLCLCALHLSHCQRASAGGMRGAPAGWRSTGIHIAASLVCLCVPTRVPDPCVICGVKGVPTACCDGASLGPSRGSCVAQCVWYCKFCVCHSAKPGMGRRGSEVLVGAQGPSLLGVCLLSVAYDSHCSSLAGQVMLGSCSHCCHVCFSMSILHVSLRSKLFCVCRSGAGLFLPTCQALKAVLSGVMYILMRFLC